MSDQNSKANDIVERGFARTSPANTRHNGAPVASEASPSPPAGPEHSQ